MTHRAIFTSAAPNPSGSYSQGIVAGPFIFTAGLGPHRPESHELVGGGIEEQTRQTLENLEAVLAAEGLGRQHVVKVTAHLQDLTRDFAGYDQAYRAFFTEPFPARTTVGSRLSGILVEIDVVAVVS